MGVREKIGEKFISVVDDGMIYGSGYVPFDDEGVNAEQTFIVKEGIINSYLADIKNGINKGIKSTGNCRVANNECPTIVRMTTTYMLGGECTFDEMINSTEYGIYI